jgi:hypothetical protein|tara:strand:- start:667 stop:2160 length:1494 start_codon:yes stop_codon:yes gene_type:complete
MATINFFNDRMLAALLGGKPSNTKITPITPVSSTPTTPLGALDRLGKTGLSIYQQYLEKQKEEAGRAEAFDMLKAYNATGGQPAYDAVVNGPMDIDETDVDLDREAEVARNQRGGISALSEPTTRGGENMQMALMMGDMQQRQATEAAELARSQELMDLENKRRYTDYRDEVKAEQARKLKQVTPGKAPGSKFEQVKDKNGRVIGQRNLITNEIKPMPNANSGRYRTTTHVDKNGNRSQVLIDTLAPGGPRIVQASGIPSSTGTPNAVTPNAVPPNAVTPNAVPPNAVTPETPPALRRPPTKGEDALDKEFSKEYANWKVGGGRGDVEKNMGQLRSAITNLKNKDKNLTGSVMGIPMSIIPDTILSLFNQGAVDTKELVSEVAQRNLRAVLGGQFAMKEGEQLISRAYNENLDEKINADRVGRLLLSMAKAYDSKNNAIVHFEKYGTLRGWKGTLPTFASIEAAANLTRESAPANALSEAEKKELKKLREDLGSGGT